MPEVVLIRSGCTDFNEQNRIQGSLEIPLNSQGEQQVRHVVEQLKNTPLEVIYADPNEPSLSTAEAVGEALGVPVKLSEDLRNLDQGLWEGLQIDDVRHKYPRAFKQWREAPETICPPEGELASAAIGRICKVLRKPLRKRMCFAVVASEPLATMIGWVVSDQKSELPDPICSCGELPRVQFFHAGPDLSDHPAAEVDTIIESRSAINSALAKQLRGNGHLGENHP